MTFELTMLTLSIILGFAQIVLASHAASLQRGYRWTASARDEVLPPLAGVAGRLARAQVNFNETFPYFSAAVLAAHMVGIHDWRTHRGAALYFAARLAYVPLYAVWRADRSLAGVERCVRRHCAPPVGRGVGLTAASPSRACVERSLARRLLLALTLLRLCFAVHGILVL